jgi:signal peptidase II
MQEGTHPRGVIIGTWTAAAFTAAVVVLADQLTKRLFLSYGAEHHNALIPNFLETIYHENQGIIANFPLPLPVTITITIIIMVVIAMGVMRSVQTNKIIPAIALAEIFGGALGNLIDRLTQGFVFDWILLFGQSAINIADLAIIEGAVVFIGWKWFEKRNAPRPETGAERHDVQGDRA